MSAVRPGSVSQQPQRRLLPALQRHSHWKASRLESAWHINDGQAGGDELLPRV